MASTSQVHFTGRPRWSSVDTVVGFLLLADAAAAGYELMTPANAENWVLVIRAELGLWGGLWLLSEIFPRRARAVSLNAFVVVLICDLTRTLMGFPPRHALGRIWVGSWWVLVIDVLAVVMLYRWRPALNAKQRPDRHPGVVAAAALSAATLGVIIDWSQIGCFPTIGTVRRAGRPPDEGMHYLVYTPSGYNRSSGRWPMILFLHGSGLAGNAIDCVRWDGLTRHVEHEGSIPFIVVAPQSPDFGWSIGVLNNLLDDVLRRYRIDEDRVYLTGLSMGGYGAWAMAAGYPKRFAAVAPICGGGNPSTAEHIKALPVWAFHGSDDQTVPVSESRRMVDAIKRLGGDAKLTIYPGVGHDSWTRTYRDPRLYEWFLAHRRQRAEGNHGGH